MIRKIDATVLFVQDLDRSLAFYRDTLKLPMQGRDPNSVTFVLEGRYFLLLKVSAAADLLGVEVSALQSVGAPRVLLAAGVDDVDAAYNELMAQGVTLLRSPIDQPWGLRTAHFADPEGNIWEINQPIVAKTTE